MVMHHLGHGRENLVAELRRPLGDMHGKVYASVVENAPAAERILLLVREPGVVQHHAAAGGAADHGNRRRELVQPLRDELCFVRASKRADYEARLLAAESREHGLMR